jgi:hypothetical protein
MGEDSNFIAEFKERISSVEIPQAMKDSMIEVLQEYEHGSCDYDPVLLNRLEEKNIFSYNAYCAEQPDDEKWDETAHSIGQAILNDMANTLYDFAMLYSLNNQ